MSEQITIYCPRCSRWVVRLQPGRNAWKIELHKSEGHSRDSFGSINPFSPECSTKAQLMDPKRLRFKWDGSNDPVPFTCGDCRSFWQWRRYEGAIPATSDGVVTWFRKPTTQ